MTKSSIGKLVKEKAIYIVLLAIILFFTAATDTFFSVNNLMNIVRQDRKSVV